MSNCFGYLLNNKQELDKLHLAIHRKLDTDSNNGYADSNCVTIRIGDILRIIPNGLLRRSL